MGRKGSFAKVLKKLPPSKEGRRVTRGMAGREVVQPGLQSFHVLKGDDVSPKGGSLGVGEELSPMAMQRVLLDMKENVDFML